MKFTEWDGQDLRGSWLFTIKIDGIQARKVDGELVSKNGKQLYNIPRTRKNFTHAEIFTGKCNETWSIISASKSFRRQITQAEIYPLFPRIDRRLYLGRHRNPTAQFIKDHMDLVVAAGHEGLVLRQGDHFIKVKTVYTVDVKITDFTEGNGRLKGSLGKLHTEQGEVGTGFTDLERHFIWSSRNVLKGSFVEVKFMEKTKNGKFRNPRFIRLRPDK